MKFFKSVPISLLALLICTGPALSSEPRQDHALYQVSSMWALKNGAYAGLTTLEQLKKYGDFGIGTLEGLDGEMVALDGVFYQVKVNGDVVPVANQGRIPFAIVTFFRPPANLPEKRISANTYDELKIKLDKIIGPKDHIYSIKVQGVFQNLKLRSVPKQKKPYPGLMEAIKGQRIFEFSNIRGTMVGFRFPEYMNGVNAGGYHFHFIGENGKVGGHALDCSLEDCPVSFMVMDRFVMEGFGDAGPSASDR